MSDIVQKIKKFTEEKGWDSKVDYNPHHNGLPTNCVRLAYEANNTDSVRCICITATNITAHTLSMPLNYHSWILTKSAEYLDKKNLDRIYKEWTHKDKGCW